MRTGRDNRSHAVSMQLELSRPTLAILALLSPVYKHVWKRGRLSPPLTHVIPSIILRYPSCPADYSFMDGQDETGSNGLFFSRV